MEQPINDTQAASLLCLSVSTLRKDRSVVSRGLNIPFVKMGDRVRYLPSQLEAWMHSRTVNPVQPQQPVEAQPQPVPMPKQQGRRGVGRPRKIQG